MPGIAACDDDGAGSRPAGRWRSLRAVLAALLLAASAVLPSATGAAEPAGGFDYAAYAARREQASRAVQTAQEKCQRLEVELRAQGAGDAQLFSERDQRDAALGQLIKDYLTSALEVLQAGLDYYYAVNQELPLVLTPGTLQGIVTRWPGNPLRGMEPLRVLRPKDGFSRGDIAWELPPPAAYSFEQGRVQPVAYQLYVYGASYFREAAAAELGPLPENRAWAEVPTGSIAVSGHSAPPFSVKLPAGQDRATLLATAEDEAWRRDAALDWAVQRQSTADGRSQAWLLRGLDSQLRSARNVDRLARTLQDCPAADWTEAQVNAYLKEALWLVYQGFNSATWAGGGGRQLDWNQVETQKLLPYWPGNPCDGWRPMRLRGPAQPFSAGDLLLLRAPAYFADAGASGGLGGSYELCVYGRSPLSTARDLNPVDARNLWAQRPRGVVADYGLFAAPQASAEFNRAICHS